MGQTPLSVWDGLQRLDAWTASRCFDTGERKAGSNSVRRRPEQHVSTGGSESHGKGEPWRGTKPKEEPGTPKAATSKGYNGLVDGVKPRGWLPSGPSIELLLAAGLCEVWLVEQ